MVYVAELTALGDEYPETTAMALIVEVVETVIDSRLPTLCELMGCGICGYIVELVVGVYPLVV